MAVAFSKGNDLFEALINLEETFVATGREKGSRVGLQIGIAEGEKLGSSKGIEKGEEVGYYFGCLEIWKLISQLFPSEFSPRCLEQLIRLERSLFEVLNVLSPTNENTIEAMEKLRSSFKCACVHFGRMLPIKNSNDSELLF